MADQIPVQQSDPVIDSAVAAIQNANAQVQAAQSRVNSTSPYTTGSMPQPQMPVPSVKGGLFQGASSRNLANEQPQTRAGARNKAVGMLAAQGARAIGTYFKKKEDEKKQNLAMDIHRSLELQSGIDEASQISEQAKAVLNDPSATPEAKQQAQQQLAQAQGVSQKNNKLLESLLNGKSGKDIAKAYDITFGAESNEKGINDKSADLHYNAMQDAMKQAKMDQDAMKQKEASATPQQQMQGNSNAMGTPPQPNVSQGIPSRLQQFQAGMPARMAVNPAYAQAQQQYEATAKNATAVQRNAMDLVAKYHKDATQVQTQAMKDRAAMERTRANNAAGIQESQTRLKGELARAQATRTSAWARIQAAQITKGGDLVKASTDVYNQATGEIKEVDKAIDSISKTIEKAQKDDSFTPELKQQLNEQLTQLKGEREQQSKLQYAANLGMSGNPQGAVLQNLILAPEYKPDTVKQSDTGEKKKGESLIDRGTRLFKGAKELFNESDGRSDKEPE